VLRIEQEVNSAPWSERSFRNELDHPHGIFRVALLQGQPVGYGGVWLLVDEAHITTVAIDETVRRNGIGRQLVVNLLLEAKEAGMLCATLEVRASNAPAVELYEKLGFQVSTRRKHYYPDNKEDALVMWLVGLDSWQPPSR
jgi:ribosomal-protein-alanine N-acetyltransferase